MDLTIKTNRQRQTVELKTSGRVNAGFSALLSGFLTHFNRILYFCDGYSFQVFVIIVSDFCKVTLRVLKGAYE